MKIPVLISISNKVTGTAKNIVCYLYYPYLLLKKMLNFSW